MASTPTRNGGNGLLPSLNNNNNGPNSSPSSSHPLSPAPAGSYAKAHTPVRSSFRSGGLGLASAAKLKVRLKRPRFLYFFRFATVAVCLVFQPQLPSAQSVFVFVCSHSGHQFRPFFDLSLLSSPLLYCSSGASAPPRGRRQGCCRRKWHFRPQIPGANQGGRFPSRS